MEYKWIKVMVITLDRNVVNSKLKEVDTSSGGITLEL
jgi:hypothetical protein